MQQTQMLEFIDCHGVHVRALWLGDDEFAKRWDRWIESDLDPEFDPEMYEFDMTFSYTIEKDELAMSPVIWKEV